MSDASLPSAEHVRSGAVACHDPAVTRSSTPFGRRAFIAGTAGAVAATALSSAAHAVVPPDASYYEAIGPVRLADTRTYAQYAAIAKDFQRVSDRIIRINIRNSPYVAVPNDAVAAVVAIAAVYNGLPGWVQAVPAGSSGTVSNINMENGDGAVANMATVRLSADGKIDIAGLHPYDVVVDIVGVYRSTAQPVRAGRTKFLAATTRAVNNRTVEANTTVTVPLNFVPASAQAVVVNLTAAACRTAGYFTAYAPGAAVVPNVSNLNYSVGEVRAGGAIVKLGMSGTTPAINVFSSGSVQMFVDVSGYITGAGDSQSDEGLFVPINPYRVLDTRRAADRAVSGKARLWPGWTRPFEVPNAANGFGPRSQIAGIAMNSTLVGAMSYGHITVLPAQTPRYEVSNLNVTRLGHTVANHVITPVSTRGVELYSFGGGDVIADVAGWYTGVPAPITSSTPPVDPPPPAAGFNWLLTVPRMGLQNWVIPNIFSGDPVVDSGNTWHWTNTGMIGNIGASIVAFGHRTSKGGPYRYQHTLVPGDELIINTPDLRVYRYGFVGERLTGSSPTEILNAARGNAGGTTFTLVACTGSSSIFDDQPRGGIRYRIVSTFALLDWTDVAPPGG